MTREAKYDDAAETLLDKWEAAMRTCRETAERLKRPVHELYWAMDALHPELLALVVDRHQLQAGMRVYDPSAPWQPRPIAGVDVPEPAAAIAISNPPCVPAPVTDESGVPQSVFVPAVEVPLPPHLASLVQPKPKAPRPLHFLQKIRAVGETLGEAEATMLRQIMKLARDCKWSKKHWQNWVGDWEDEKAEDVSDGLGRDGLLARAAVARAIKPILAKDAPVEATVAP